MAEIKWENKLHSKHGRFKIFEPISDLFREIKFAYQRVFRKYDDTMVGDIDFYLMRIIPILITEFRKQKPGLSSELFDGLEMDEHSGYSEKNERIAQERYDIILDKIIEGFQSYEKINYNLSGNREELQKKFDEGFELFHHYFNTLNN